MSVQSGITSPKLPPIAVQYTAHVYHMTTIPQCYWRKFLWRHARLYRLYIRFGIILTQFYINFSRQDSQVSAYTPFHFSFTVPLIYFFNLFELQVSCSNLFHNLWYIHQYHHMFQFYCSGYIRYYKHRYSCPSCLCIQPTLHIYFLN